MQLLGTRGTPDHLSSANGPQNFALTTCIPGIQILKNHQAGPPFSFYNWGNFASQVGQFVR